MSDPILSLNEISYSYPSNWGGKRTPALHDISLDVFAGESFGFLGHSGSGKTTTIKCILNLIQPQQGSISLFGESNRKPESRRSIGYLPEQPYFYDHLTVSELVEMYAHLSGVERARVGEAVRTALDRVGLSGRTKSPLRSLSKGLTQRVGMAQAIVSKPKLLILDEPFSGLDPLGRKEFKDLLFELKAAGTTTFFSSHILGDIQFFCDRVSIMSHGSIKRVLSLHELNDRSDADFQLVLEGEDSELAAFAEAADGSERRGPTLLLMYKNEKDAFEQLQKAIHTAVTVHRFERIGESLEELFIKLVQGGAGEDGHV